MRMSSSSRVRISVREKGVMQKEYVILGRRTERRIARDGRAGRPAMRRWDALRRMEMMRSDRC